MIDKNPEKIKNMFNSISIHYDKINDIISFFTHKYAKYVVIKNLNIKDNYSVLDLCTGSGDIANIIKKINKKTNVIGIDFSEKMLEIAKKKNKEIDFQLQDATNLPFENESFDIITISFGLRNIENQTKALEEIYRVLKKDGIFLHLDFNKKNFLNKFWDKIVIFILKIFFKKIEPYIYLIQSKNDFFDNNELINIFKKHNFKYKKSKIFLLNMLAYQIMTK